MRCRLQSACRIGVVSGLTSRGDLNDKLGRVSIPLAQVGATHVQVFYSRQDEALGAAFQAAEIWATSGAEGKKALGLHGHVGDSHPVTRDGQSYEQTDMEHLSHGPFGYVNDERVQKAACEALGNSAELARQLSLASCFISYCDST